MIVRTRYACVRTNERHTCALEKEAICYANEESILSNHNADDVTPTLTLTTTDRCSDGARSAKTSDLKKTEINKVF